MVYRLLAGALALAFFACAPAQARHHHQTRHHHRGGAGPIACQLTGAGGSWLVPGSCEERRRKLQQHCVVEREQNAVRCDVSGRVADRSEIVAHPAGCPHVAFCGCGAAIEVFGHSVRSLWLARAWLRFPPASPAPGMAAVRTHHVMIIREYLGEDRALVYDANSGHHLTRVHVVSLWGYRIVNPKERYL